MKRFPLTKKIVGIAALKPKNGAGSIEFDDTDFFAPFNVEADVENWSTWCCLSNIEKEFIGDIVSAFENYFGFKVCCHIKTNLMIDHLFTFLKRKIMSKGAEIIATYYNQE